MRADTAKVKRVTRPVTAENDWEAKRLAALCRYGIPDTESEPAFDDLTRLAAEICQTPIALINLIDRDRLWVKSSFGLKTTELRREVSFCDYAIRDTELFLVEDALQDPRFAANPLVKSDPCIRFYAGAPLVTEDGHALGTLCVIDLVPRRLDQKQKELLLALARQVMTQLELRRHVAELEQQARERAEAEELARHHSSKLGVVLDSITDGFFSVDREWRFTYFNRAAEELSGRRRDELIGKCLWDEFPQAAGGHFEEMYRKVMEGGQPVRFEGHNSARERWYEVRVYPAQNGISVYFHDATNRKLLSRALAESERRHRDVIENVREVIFQADKSGRLVFLNRAWTEVTGFSVEEGRGSHFFEYLAAEDKEATIEHFRSFIENHGEHCKLLVRHLTRNSGYRWMEVHARMVFDAEGNMKGTAGTLRDVHERIVAEEALRKVNEELEDRVAQRTVELQEANELLEAELQERRRVEAALKQTERDYRGLFEQAHDAIIIFDPEDEIVIEVNRRACEVYGFDRSEFIGLSLETISKNVSVGKELVGNTLDARGSFQFETTQRRKDGSLMHLEVNASVVKYQGRQVILSINRDVTERKLGERALSEGREWLAAIFAASRDGIVVEKGGHVVYANEAFGRLYGYEHPEELLGSPVSRFHGSGDNLRMAHYTEQRLSGEDTPSVYEFKGLRHDGSEIELEASVSAFKVGGKDYIITVLRDIFERKQLERQFRQAQKMEAVGRLAGGVAHDFNNLLTIISGNSDLLLRRVGDDTRFGKKIEDIKVAASRASKLTRQLLAFSRKQVLQPVALDLNKVVNETGRMLKRLIGEDVSLYTLLEPETWRVKADPGQIEQVIMNLAVNARDAMPQGGTLSIATKNLSLDECYVRQHIAVQPGRYVLLTVTDNGCGMSAETMAHIFEPFYTTKEVGQGTGLGLSTVYGIIEQSGGAIGVYSEVGQGTTFKIYLPAYEGPEEEPATRTDMSQPPVGSETILLVEDEDMLRDLTKEVLEMSGYNVLMASSGVEALEISRQHGGKISLLLTDVVMPGMSGRELSEQLLAHSPETRVLFMSGYTDDAVLRHGLLDTKTSYLEKPFTHDSLARKIRSVLEAKGPDN